MRISFLHTVKKSFLFNIRNNLLQVAIIILLTAVITGSLMTGSSVRESLKRTSLGKIGNTGMLISTGPRYTSPSLAGRISALTGVQCTGLLETEGFCQNFLTQNSVQDVNIYAVDNDFFSFNGNHNLRLNKGEVFINSRLAERLDLKEGDQITLRFNPITDIPAGSPFASGKSTNTSLVLGVAGILDPDNCGNFSLGISQLIPLNIFISRSSLADSKGNIPGINRLLINRHTALKISDIQERLPSVIEPSDLGLTVRDVTTTGETEIISNRIFLDKVLVDDLIKAVPSSYPVITWLANNIKDGTLSTPYSFVSAIDSGGEKETSGNNGIILNEWAAKDLNAGKGDTVSLSWYSGNKVDELKEVNGSFLVKDIVPMKGIYGDSLLMPEFEGIAGKASCASWDAGIDVKTNLIRDRDEQYWNRYRGMPKAFISYSKGSQMWGNNFGPATAIRVSGLPVKNVASLLHGKLDPFKSGFSVTDIYSASEKAADEGVDFSTLFLSLGFFIIISAVILLILVASTFLDKKRDQVKTLFALGFPDKVIRRLLFYETCLTALSGAVAGAFTGVLFNMLIIKALSSVWIGAVQTGTLVAAFDCTSLLIGMFFSLIIILVIQRIKVLRFLKRLRSPEEETISAYEGKNSYVPAVSFVVLAVAATSGSFLSDKYETLLSFSGGVLFFIACLFLIRWYFKRLNLKKITTDGRIRSVSDSYFAANSSQVVAPVLFIAAGLFAVIITAVNRMNLSESSFMPSGGTGGFLLWGESSIAVPTSLKSDDGRRNYGLDDPELKDMTILQVSRTRGNDASCLNLNHIQSPPLLGIDPTEFIKTGAFSFASKLRSLRGRNPWISIDQMPENNTVCGIADQTVLEYGLKIRTGDTLKIRSETGQILNIIISAGLKSSVFQGYVIIGKKNLSTFFPSSSGSGIFLINGNRDLTETYRNTLSERLSEFGVHFETTGERLSSFFVVTNTYLSVFTILGSIGLILGVAGLGFILLRNFNHRKKDFGIMMATGFSEGAIRRILLKEQIRILILGVITGLFPALIATRSSLENSSQIPWPVLAVMIVLVMFAGLTALLVSIMSIKKDTILSTIRGE